MIASCFAQTVMILESDFTVRALMFFLMGLTQIKVGVSYVWLSECVGFSYKSTSFTLINIFDGMTMAILCVYYLTISRDWIWLCSFFCLLTYLATFALLFCPESPRWHLVNGRAPEAIKVLNEMAVMNGSEERIPDEAIFVEDPSNFDVTINPSTGQLEERFSEVKVVEEKNEDEESNVPLFHAVTIGKV